MLKHEEKLYKMLIKYEVGILRSQAIIEDKFHSIGLFGTIFDDEYTGNYQLLKYILDQLSIKKDSVISRDPYYALYFELYSIPNILDKDIDKFLKDIIKLKNKINKDKI